MTENLNRGLIHFGKYVVAPATLLPIRRGAKKPYEFLTIDQLQAEFGERVTITPFEEPSDAELSDGESLPGFVAVLRNGWCHGRYCDWVGIENRPLRDFRLFDGARRMSARKYPMGRLNPRYYRQLLTTPDRFPRPTRVAGRVLVLNKGAAHNYYHWITEVLPRLELARRAGWTEADYYVVDCYKPFQRQTLQSLGIPREKVIEPHNGLLIEADELIVPSLATALARSRTGEMLREAFGVPSPPQVGGTRRIFVSRKNARTRRIANETQIEEVLTPLGFEFHCLEQYTLAKQIQLFGEAEMIVGGHGAGLTNMLYAQAGTRVIELAPSNYIRKCYAMLSEELGHPYSLVEAHRSRRSRNLHVPCDDLLAAVTGNW
ncbi:MAG: glycosyltransferase family 61 protein [Pirellulaceae bacterium]|nr:glycosyltransferase family 61 protein [Pirellulaceae bacterium]